MRKLFRGDLLCSFVAFNTVQSISLLPKNPIYFIYFTQVILTTREHILEKCSKYSFKAFEKSS